MIVDWLLGIFSPHLCKGCDKVGNGLCEDCFIDIIDCPYDLCIHCGELSSNNLCRNCRMKLPFDRAFVIGERRAALRRLVGDFKYNSEKAQARVIAKLLDATLPSLPGNIVVVPIPTIAPHVRQRGLDHTKLIAKSFANRRKLKFNDKILRRQANSIQHGLSAAERKKQAEKAFMINKRVNLPKEVLLIDDIYTTGATMIAASKLLKKAGVETINIAIVARHSKP